jgi:Flp pilus assembly protein TadD
MRSHRKPTFLAVLLLAVHGCTRPKQQVQESNGYINTHVCASCHTNIYEHYKFTGMARAFSIPSAGNIVDPIPFFHRASGIWFQMISKDRHWVQRSWQIGYDGRIDNVQEWTVDYVIGSGNHVRTYLHRTAQGSFIELPLAWYAENGGTWTMNPGFDNSRPPIGRRIGYNCMFCHNAYPKIPPDHDQVGAEPVFSEPLPEGIDCQRCHGPGANHVRATKPADFKKTIFNPRNNVDVCQQCHLETTSGSLPNSIRRFNRAPFSYRPGEPLSAFRLIFDHPAGAGKDDKFEIVSSAYRLRKSQCFIASKEKLFCTTCHNPHDIPHGPSASDHYDEVCRQCHAVVEVPNHPKSKDCVGCHMPKRRTEDVVHAVMTDHLIQRRPVPISEQNPDYHGEVVPYGDSDPLYTAVAQVITKTNLAAGTPRLVMEIERHQPSEPEFYLELGEAYVNTKQFDKAIEQFQQALSRRPNSPLFLRQLATAYRGAGQLQNAIDALQKAEAWNDLGPLLAEAGRKSDAIAALRKAIVLDPESAEAQNSLGAILAETGQFDQAESAMRTALRLQPTLSEAHGNLANLLAAKNNLLEAAWHYERAGSKAVYQFNYGVTLARMNRLADAEAHIWMAIRADPNLAEAHDVLGGLLENRGRLDAALTQYREAIRIRPSYGKAHLDLGTILFVRHDLAAAAREFRLAASDANPAVRQQAQQALGQLK